ncbi:hypothetical protein [Chryseobacterium caseinilyticum]|uniref:YD repeat-containing protein n=1 Tax=Chryseobacterium caseinilyticum TaxID=2771428 RepID=A0ABR8ZGB7_9FLAO|nr:hypothetical protein [Chryseobacterium caseinilyticum]MBD8084338.1 hypothetical protein [Chryseobacterium caseinilyticum]
MTKNNFITGVYAFSLAFVLSCDNTTADPINNNLNNPNNAGSTGGTAPTILGPRILHKVTVNNEPNQEYVTTGTTLEKAIFKESSGPNSFLIGRVTYTSGKISRVKFEQEVNGAVPANNMSHDYHFTYDSGGKINYTTCTRMIGTMSNFDSEYTYTYDGSGKMTKIVEKKKAGTTYTHFTNYTLTNTGDNITKMIMENGTTSSTGVPDLSNTFTYTYNFDGYDNKINPYTTLPKTFFVAWSLLHPANFSALSANNVTSFTIVNPSPAPSIPGAYTYLYDSQNYPVSDQTQIQKYIYKAL